MVAIAIYIRLRLQETADLPGYKGQGPDLDEPVERGILEFEHQVCADRQHRGHRRVASCGTAAVWALYYLQQVMKPDACARPSSRALPYSSDRHR